MNVHGYQISLPQEIFSLVGNEIKETFVWLGPFVIDILQKMGKALFTSTIFVITEGQKIATRTYAYAQEHPDYTTIVITLMAFSYLTFAYGYYRGRLEESEKRS